MSREAIRVRRHGQWWCWFIPGIDGGERWFDTAEAACANAWGFHPERAAFIRPGAPL